jgi:UDP-N-acetylmuramoylalanine--D-glutamate ligase
MEAAVRAATKLAQPGDTVLLSPACASLDMYRDYQERGEAFTVAVQAVEEVS